MCKRLGDRSVSGAFSSRQSDHQETNDMDQVHVALSNTSDCAVKPLFSELLRKVSELAKSERRKEGRGKERGNYHGEVIKEAELGGNTQRYHWHLGSL